MKRTLAIVLILICMVSFSACGAPTSVDSASDVTSKIVTAADEYARYHSYLIGAAFEYNTAFVVDDANTRPIVDVVVASDIHMEIALQKYESELDADLTELTEEMFAATIEVLLTEGYPAREIAVSNIANYALYDSNGLKYSRVSAQILNETVTTRLTYATFYFVKLSTGKQLAIICEDDAQYSHLDDFTRLVESLTDTNDSAMSDQALSMADIAEWYWLSV